MNKSEKQPRCPECRGHNIFFAIKSKKNIDIEGRFINTKFHCGICKDCWCIAAVDDFYSLPSEQIVKVIYDS